MKKRFVFLGQNALYAAAIFVGLCLMSSREVSAMGNGQEPAANLADCFGGDDGDLQYPDLLSIVPHHVKLETSAGSDSPYYNITNPSARRVRMSRFKVCSSRQWRPNFSQISVTRARSARMTNQANAPAKAERLLHLSLASRTCRRTPRSRWCCRCAAGRSSDTPASRTSHAAPLLTGTSAPP